MRNSVLVSVLIIVSLPLFFWRAWVGLRLNERNERRAEKKRQHACRDKRLGSGDESKPPNFKSSKYGPEVHQD